MDQEQLESTQNGIEGSEMPITINKLGEQLDSGMRIWQNVCVAISRDVEQYCEEHGIERKFPVDIEHVARTLELDVAYVDLNPVEVVNTFSISGTTMEWRTMKNKNRKLVCIDSSADKNVQRYALAFEVGIQMLSRNGLEVHKGYNYSVPILPIDPKKFLAEIYAMCLLLPWKELMSALNDYVGEPKPASPIDNVEWIDYLADQAKMPRNNLCIGFSYISKIVCMECEQDEQLKEKFRKILQY